MGRKSIFLAIFVVVLLVVTMPLRLAISWAQPDHWLSATEVDGTVWSGVLRAGHVGRLSLGDARVGLHIPTLLSGHVGFVFSADRALKGSGIAVLGGDGPAVRAKDLRFPISAAAPSLPLEGEMHLSGIDVSFRDGACRTARGSVMLEKARLLHRGVQAAPEFQLRGVLGCAGGDVVMRLAGQSGDLTLHTVIRVNATGTYQIENRIQGISGFDNAMAVAAGFQWEVDGYARVDRGSLAL